MSEELKRVYEKQGALDRYFDTVIPKDLYRGYKKGATYDLMQPTLLGFYIRGNPRLPDVHVSAQDSKISPQFTDATERELVVDDTFGSLTVAMVANADKYMVRGCRTMDGEFRGVSLFDKKNERLRNHSWYKIPKGAEIPEALACTRDGPADAPYPVHYTIAPKDDMPLSLFLQHLKVLTKQAVKDI